MDEHYVCHIQVDQSDLVLQGFLLAQGAHRGSQLRLAAVRHSVELKSRQNQLTKVKQYALLSVRKCHLFLKEAAATAAVLSMLMSLSAAIVYKW